MQRVEQAIWRRKKSKREKCREGRIDVQKCGDESCRLGLMGLNKDNFEKMWNITGKISYTT